jgi:hypothetical protein
MRLGAGRSRVRDRVAKKPTAQRPARDEKSAEDV